MLAVTNALSILMVFCGMMVVQDPAHTKAGAANAKPAATLPADLFVDMEPDGAKSPEEIKASAKPGDKVAIRGRIGGSPNPFVEGRAVFTLMGPGLKACSDNPEDKCATPWDYCCETAADIAKHSAMVQVVDAAGTPLRTGLKGVNGLKELSQVTVQGVVHQANDKILVVSATAIYVATVKKP